MNPGLSLTASRRNGRLKLPLSFDEAVKAALKVDPPKEIETSPP